MRKSEQYSVAIFLAVALFAGTIAGSSAPAFVVDAQATEDKKDYKEKDRNYDKDYRHDDNKKYGGHDDYGKDRENKYGHDDYGKDRENKYGHDDYGKDRENRDGHDDKSSVKYIKCNNVNINGKGGHSDRGNDNWPRDGGNDWRSGGGNDWPRDGGNDWPRDGGNDWPRGGDNHNVPGFVKHTDKDVVVICIFNNDGKKDNKTAPINDCLDCFITTNEGGFLPPGQLEQFEDFLAELPPGVEISNIQELCDAIEAGDVTEAQLEEAIEIVFGSGMSGNLPPFAEKLLDCLISFLPPV